MVTDHESFIIIQLKHDSHQAFNYLYDTYADMLYGFVLLHTKSAYTAEEIVQNTFVKIWTRRRELTVEGSFKSLLFTIARNQIVDTFRSQINKVEFAEFIEYCEETRTSSNTVEADIYFEDFCAKLNEVKKELSDRQRIIFEMSRERGLDVNTIASRLNIAEQTVKNQLSTALKFLREKLKHFNYILF